VQPKTDRQEAKGKQRGVFHSHCKPLRFETIDRVTLLATKYPLLTWRSKLTEMGSNGQQQTLFGRFWRKAAIRPNGAVG
jgi:hypothetical protein